MMADIELDIKTALFACLARITRAGGYNTDAGDRIWKGEEYRVQPPEKPCLLVAFGEREDTLGGEVPPSQGEENHFLPVTITGVIDDNESGEKAELLKKDILKAIKVDPYLGGLTEGFEGGIKSSSATAPAVTIDADGNQVETGGFVGSAEVGFSYFYVTAYGEE